jgi:hypothetical protein
MGYLKKTFRHNIYFEDYTIMRVVYLSFLRGMQKYKLSVEVLISKVTKVCEA